MVILSHMRSLTSRPDSGEAMALATDAMSECSDKFKSSKPGGRHESMLGNFKRQKNSHRITSGSKTRRRAEELKGIKGRIAALITSHKSSDESKETDGKHDSWVHVVRKTKMDGD